MTPLSYQLSSLSLIALETMRLLVLTGCLFREAAPRQSEGLD